MAKDKSVEVLSIEEFPVPDRVDGMWGDLDGGKQAGEQPGGSAGTIVSIFVI